MCCSPSYRFNMMPLQMNSIWLILSSLTLLLCIQSGYAIQCFECNSYNDSRCAQKEPPLEFLKDCSEHKEGNKYSLCRKIVQNIEFEVNGLKPDSRVIRACGWDKTNYENRCYQRSGFGGRQEVCTCQTDKCNAAGQLTVTPVLALGIYTTLHLLISRYLF